MGLVCSSFHWVVLLVALAESIWHGRGLPVAEIAGKKERCLFERERESERKLDVLQLLLFLCINVDTGLEKLQESSK